MTSVGATWRHRFGKYDLLAWARSMIGQRCRGKARVKGRQAPVMSNRVHGEIEA